VKNESQWKPSKFLVVDGNVAANPNRSCVAISSRLNVNLLGGALQRVLAEFACGRMLDLGCGQVPLFDQYRKRITEVICVDWVNSNHDISHVDVEADLNMPIPIDSNQFDTVLLTDVLEHIAAPEALLNETRRLLRNGGCLIGSVPFLYRLHEEPHDHYRYTIHTLRRLAAQHKFAIEVLEPYGHGTDVLFDVLGKLVEPLHWRIGPRLASWIQNLGLLVRKSTFGRKCNKHNQNMPLGYVFVLRAT
jgi:SAM-dependent methyltransferase